MISNTKLKERIRKKTNPSLAEVIREAHNHEPWKGLAVILAGSTRKQSAVNLFEIDKVAKEGDTIVVPGKILSHGRLTKRIVICALSISEKAKEKLKENKSSFVLLIDEIKKNKKAEGVKLIR